VHKIIKNPLVSVIVTTYNRSSLVLETIDSILSQTYQNLELIIVDDGSTDNTSEVVNSVIDSRIIYIKTENYGGPARPRNIGIRKAKGIYIAFCDDDDIWVSDKLENQLNYLVERQVDLVSSKMYVFKTNIKNPLYIRNNRPIKSISDLLSHNQINTSTVLVKKVPELVFPEDKALISIEDYALWLKLYINNYKFGFISEPLVYYRIFDNISSKNRALNHFRIIYLMIYLEITYGIMTKHHIMKHFLKGAIKSIFIKLKLFKPRYHMYKS